MKQIIFIFLIIAQTSILSQNIAIKEKIERTFYSFSGDVSQSKIDTLLTTLNALSTDSKMCFNSLFSYNNCEDYSDSLYAKVRVYLDDLIGKEVDVALTKWNKPWEDENFYTLRFEMSYENDNEEFPVEINFDTFILDVSEDKIVNVIMAREWIELSEYGVK